MVSNKVHCKKDLDTFSTLTSILSEPFSLLVFFTGDHISSHPGVLGLVVEGSLSSTKAIPGTLGSWIERRELQFSQFLGWMMSVVFMQNELCA